MKPIFFLLFGIFVSNISANIYCSDVLQKAYAEDRKRTEELRRNTLEDINRHANNLAARTALQQAQQNNTKTFVPLSNIDPFLLAEIVRHNQSVIK